MLLLHGMGEMALVHPEKKDELLRRTIGLFQKYRTKEIKGGEFHLLRGGRNWGRHASLHEGSRRASEQVDDCAQRMVQKQKRSTEGC